MICVCVQIYLDVWVGGFVCVCKYTWMCGWVDVCDLCVCANMLF